MELTESQFQRIADCLPRQRGNVGMTNLKLLNALLYVVEHGCKWRGLPKHFGNWHTIYTRMNRWSKAGVLDRVFARLAETKLNDSSGGSKAIAGSFAGLTSSTSFSWGLSSWRSSSKLYALVLTGPRALTEMM